MKRKREQLLGFTLIEVIVVLSILGLIFAISVPNYLGVKVGQEEAACEHTRGFIFKQINMKLVTEDLEEETLLAEIESGDFSSTPQCPSGGDYSITKEEDEYRVFCTVHSADVTLKTPLGNTFEEIVQGFTDLTKTYIDKTGEVPKTWGERQYTDIGLEEETWDNVFTDHIEYKPVGDILNISVEVGYHLSVSTEGQSNIKVKGGSSLVYNYAEATWYTSDDETGEKLVGDILLKDDSGNLILTLPGN